MRKRYRVLVLASLVAAIAGPMYARTSVNATTAMTTVIAASPVQVPANDPVPGAGKLLLVGSLLFGLSAVVRKAI